MFRSDEVKRQPDEGGGGSETPPPAIQVIGLSKVFPGVQALRHVDLNFYGGEIHGLVGQNGAGKSTLTKIITGAYAPSEGSVNVFGHALTFGDPRTSEKLGIGVVYQELDIVPERSAAANVFLGQPKRWGPFALKRPTDARFRELARRLDCTVEPNARAGALSVGNQQMVAILRALEVDRRVLIFDEPTASLGPRERGHLHGVLRELRRSGVAVIYISHQLDEVLEVCDRVSVMRDGELVASKLVSQWKKEELVEAMLGHVALKPSRRAARTIVDEEVLRVEDVVVPGHLEKVSFTVKRGEILGIAGLVGSGRTELLKALAGAGIPVRGRLFIRGQRKRWPRTIREALRMGIALCPEDRFVEGLVPTLTAAANITLTDIGAIATGPVVRESKRYRRAENIARSLDLALSRLREPASSLSGGNQQKLVVAKWLHRRPDLLLLDEPMRGIDVGAKADMLTVLTRLADDGMAVIVVSSELEEVIEAADRVLVLARGQAVAILDRQEASLERVLRLVFGLEEAM